MLGPNNFWIGDNFRFFFMLNLSTKICWKRKFLGPAFVNPINYIKTSHDLLFTIFLTTRTIKLGDKKSFYTKYFWNKIFPWAELCQEICFLYQDFFFEQKVLETKGISNKKCFGNKSFSNTKMPTIFRTKRFFSDPTFFGTVNKEPVINFWRKCLHKNKPNCLKHVQENQLTAS